MHAGLANGPELQTRRPCRGIAGRPRRQSLAGGLVTLPQSALTWESMRWHVAHATAGRGHLHPGRFKSPFLSSIAAYLLLDHLDEQLNQVAQLIDVEATVWIAGYYRQCHCDFPAVSQVALGF